MTHTSTIAAKSLSLPNAFLRLEGLTVFIAAILLYASQSGSAVAFILLLLVPDVSMIGYKVNIRVGSMVYNLVHTYALPALLVGLALAFNVPVLLQIAFIWFAHIGMDRTVGYGLKYATNFKDTHLQRV
ncbi:MAG: DUF4260 domain-containing protein [Anaerolineae bacterium]|nr:DUF4260 domain-containing protein [Anaerolineae bacterium]